MLHRHLVVAFTVIALLGCKDQKQLAAEKQRALEEAKAAQKAAQEAKEKGGGAKPSTVKLEPFWDDAAYLKVSPDGQCPEGLWALFAGEPPGEGEAKQANAAQKEELAQKLRDSTFVVHLKAPTTVKLKDFDAPKGVFPLEVVGTVDCVDSIGRIALTWTSAKAVTPGASAGREGAELAESIWQAETTHYTYPMKTMAEAKEFLNKHRFDIDARIVFRLGKAETHKRMVKIAKVSAGEVTLGGGMEDWGAGRRVVAEVQGVRISTDHEKTALIENRGN